MQTCDVKFQSDDSLSAQVGFPILPYGTTQSFPESRGGLTVPTSPHFHPGRNRAFSESGGSAIGAASNHFLSIRVGFPTLSTGT